MALDRALRYLLLVIGLCGGLGACFAAVDEEAWKKDGGGGPGSEAGGSVDLADVVDTAVEILDAPATGCAWRPVTSGTTTALNSVWGSSTSDVWAVGDDGLILRFNGKSWSKVTSPVTQNLYEVTGTSSNDVWAVGSGGKVIRFDGTKWSSVSQIVATTSLYGVWSLSPTEVWAVGAGGVILRYKSYAWAKIPSGTTVTLYEIWGTSASEIWAVGNSGNIRRYDGSAWTRVVSGTLSLSLRHVVGCSGSGVWATGHCYSGKPKDCESRVLLDKGTGWTTLFRRDGERLRGIWADSSTDVWAVGDGCCGGAGCDCGQIRHYDGKEWTTSTAALQSKGLNSVWGIAECDVWAVGEDGQTMHRSIP